VRVWFGCLAIRCGRRVGSALVFLAHRPSGANGNGAIRPVTQLAQGSTAMGRELMEVVDLQYKRIESQGPRGSAGSRWYCREGREGSLHTATAGDTKKIQEGTMGIAGAEKMGRVRKMFGEENEVDVSTTFGTRHPRGREGNSKGPCNLAQASQRHPKWERVASTNCTTCPWCLPLESTEGLQSGTSLLLCRSERHGVALHEILVVATENSLCKSRHDSSSIDKW
jgi:hypothetical protein